MTYVSGGDFKKDLEFVFGKLKKRKTPEEDIKFTFKAKTNKEVTALYKLFQTFDLPEIGDLDWSYFYSIAESYDADEEELEDEYGMDDEQERALLLNTIEVFGDCGAPFFTFGDEGVCIAYDGPFEISVCYDDIGGFLRFLVHLSGAKNGKIPLADLKKEFKKELAAFEGRMFVDRCLEAAAEHEQDNAYEEGLDANDDVFDPTGLSFLFTGKLASMTRKEAQSRVDEIGGENAKSVTKNLDVLVIGDEGSPLYGEGSKGSKQKKADKLIEDGAAMKIISESLFLRLQ